MYIPNPPPVPADTLADSELLRLVGVWGRFSKVAVRRALALLPEIIRRGLFRRFAASPYEFAHKKLGVTRDIVDRILSLFDKIGHMPELWSLLATGEEGWSKLEVVARVATPDKAAWWARQVKKCTKAELSELVSGQAGPKSSSQSSRSTSLEGAATGSRSASTRDPSTPPSLDTGVPSAGGTDQAGGAGGGGGGGQPADLLAAEQLMPGSDQIVRGGVHPLPDADRNLPVSESEGPGGDRTPAASEHGGSGGERMSGAAEGMLPGTEHLAETSSRQNAPRGVTVYLTRQDEDLLRAWQAQMQRCRGEAVSLGEVVGRLLRGERPPTDLIATGGDVAATNFGPAAPTEGSPAATDAATPVTLSTPPPRWVEVVIRAEGLPAGWTGRLAAVLPAGIAAAFDSKASADFGDLYLEAIEAAKRSKGDWIPFAVRKAVALRAGFRCETGECDRPLHELDHVLPRAEGGDNHPDNLRARCHKHHRMRHKGLYGDANASTLVQAGEPDPSGAADRAFQAVSARSSA